MGLISLEDCRSLFKKKNKGNTKFDPRARVGLNPTFTLY